MNKVRIKISGLYDITRFVEQASKVGGTGVIVSNGRMIIDGSSLMGMMSLDTSKGIMVEYPSSAEEFHNFIQEFVDFNYA